VGRSAVNGPIQGAPVLQRFFSTFPGGWPGAGLLLLRAVAGGAAVSQGTTYVSTNGEPTTAWALGGLALLSGIGLGVGLLTPGAAAGVTVSTLAIAATAATPGVAGSATGWPSAAFVAVDALALAMLGPGAYSIDAWLFGRREILVSDHRQRRP
jgi:uncharacterized membrane protein YphA (DoxX/SURF4 family)